MGTKWRRRGRSSTGRVVPRAEAVLCVMLNFRAVPLPLLGRRTLPGSTERLGPNSKSCPLRKLRKAQPRNAPQWRELKFQSQATEQKMLHPGSALASRTTEQQSCHHLPRVKQTSKELRANSYGATGWQKQGTAFLPPLSSSCLVLWNTGVDQMISRNAIS